jgi:hypothetical protein
MKRPMVAFLTQLLLAIRLRFTRRARLRGEDCHRSSCQWPSDISSLAVAKLTCPFRRERPFSFIILATPLAFAYPLSRPERKYISGRRENASVGGAEESWFGFWQGEREGDHPPAIAANN